jgi:hypothetical protein
MALIISEEEFYKQIFRVEEKNPLSYQTIEIHRSYLLLLFAINSV